MEIKYIQYLSSHHSLICKTVKPFFCQDYMIQLGLKRLFLAESFTQTPRLHMSMRRPVNLNYCFQLFMMQYSGISGIIIKTCRINCKGLKAMLSLKGFVGISSRVFLMSLFLSSAHCMIVFCALKRMLSWLNPL